MTQVAGRRWHRSAALCAAVPAMHPSSEGSWLLSHKELLDSVTMLLQPGLPHRTNGGAGKEAAEESELLAAAEDDPTRSAEANRAGFLWG